MSNSSTSTTQPLIRDLWGAIPPIVEADELSQWILQEDDDLLVINKPGWLVCHPSKNGPASSLVGAVRTYLGSDKLHLVSRLDRETSGLILFAKNKSTSRLYQMALQQRQVEKTYLALVKGVMPHPIEIDKPLTDDKKSPVHIKQKVVACGGESLPPANTRFVPKASGASHTLCEVYPTTGRKHQIRAHAHFIGHPIIGDKLYGPDPLLYLRFIEAGWTAEHAQQLDMQRQALHCSQLRFQFPDGSSRCFSAPEPEDFAQTCRQLL